ncbi:hypothetical protein Tco_0079698 [Tanacetum coccineum]
MRTEMELTLEQTQQGVSNEVSVDPHGFEGIFKDGDGVRELQERCIIKGFKLSNQERYEHVSPEVTSSQDGKDYKMVKRDYAWLMISRIDATEMGLDIANTLCFHLGGARRSMTWRQFILALGLHTAEEMAGDGFEAYWVDSLRGIADKGDLSDYWARISSDADFLRVVPSYTYIRDPLRILCHRLIAVSISGRGRAPEKVTATNLFYLRSMDEGTAVNVPYLLAQYLFIHAEGRKRGTRLFGGHFVRRLTEHFELVAPGPESQPIATTGSLEVVEGAPDVNEGAQTVLEPLQAP